MLTKLRYAIVIALLLAALTAVILLASPRNGTDTVGNMRETAQETEESDTLPNPDSVSYPDEELPRVYITTDGGVQATSKDEYIDCIFRIEQGDRYASSRSNYTDSDGGKAEIRCRGNASYTNPEMREKNKYSYKIKLDKKADVLGMGKNKHWYLINNWRDTSNLRHKIAYDMAAMLGLAHVDCTWVELWYNGEYRGLYLLTESISIGEDRVDTFDWEEFAEDVAAEYADSASLSGNDEKRLEDAMCADLSWISTGSIGYTDSEGKAHKVDLTPYFDKSSLDLTSGYLIEYCTSYDSEGTKWKTEMGVPTMMDSPEMLHTNSEMYEYVHTLVQDFENAVRSPDFHNGKGKHYSEYVDVDSLVDYWMVWNFLCNNEFGARSIYYYIDGGKIHFGPIWDFDQTSGNVITVESKNSKGDYWVHDKKNAWFRELFGDPWFTALCQERWYSIREGIDDLITSVDVYADYMLEAAERCYERNGVRFYTIRNPDGNGGKSMAPAEDIALIRRWMRERVQWIDECFSYTAPNVDDGGYVRSEYITVTATHNRAELEREEACVHASRADYILSPDAQGAILVKIFATHKSAASVEVDLNGTSYLGTREVVSADGAIFYSIDISELDMRDGALNVLYVIMRKSNGDVLGTSSLVIRTTSVGNPESDECLVRLDEALMIVKEGATLTFPEITETRDGYVAWGWTTGDDRVYRAGESVTVEEDSYYFVRWKRLDRFSIMLLER